MVSKPTGTFRMKSVNILWGDKTVLTVDYGDGVEVSFLMWENKMSSAQQSTELFGIKYQFHIVDNGWQVFQRRTRSSSALHESPRAGTAILLFLTKVHFAFIPTQFHIFCFENELIYRKVYM